MKNPRRLVTAAAMSVTGFLVLAAGCSYDVAAPLWEQPYSAPPTPSITSIQPASAPAGVNTILIAGQNLSGVPMSNGVYFDITPADIVQKSATAITVRRPSLATSSCTVNLVSDSALVVAKISFGNIDLVMDRVGNFLDNVALAAVVVDSAENLFVISGVTPVSIWKVSTGGDKSALMTSGITVRPPFDAALRSGVLYLTSSNREIQQVNIATGVVSRWTQLPAGRVVKVGDFDANGYFYTGGAAGGDLCVIPPNPPTTLTLAQITLSGFYAADEILAVRVFKGYLYVASKATGQTAGKIWRHALGNAGQLGTQELVLDLSAHATFAARQVKAISLSASGVLYVTTDAENPLLVFDPANGSLDYFYKGIVPPYGKHAGWGRSVYLYMISGDIANTNTALRWNVARVNMGTPGASSQ
ncbi:MAG: hypothetical protein H6Q31_769 [Bacteroidetes bacterium]|nr:hypothetical protein [Bacteroidota bacterium]